MDDKQVEKLLHAVSKLPEKGGLTPGENIRAAVQAKLSRPPVWRRTIDFRIPLYQLAAAAVLAVFGFAGVTFLRPPKQEVIVIQSTRPDDYDKINAAMIKIGVTVGQDRLKSLCDSLLL
jgi:hypothetical protein